MKKKIWGVSFLAIFLFTATTTYAAHYLLGVSAVDEKEIRWGGSTLYSSEWNAAISNWNSRGKVNIAPDTAATYQDLTLSDVDSATGMWLGKAGSYRNSLGSDTLQLNKHYLKSNTIAERQNTAAHELGHALGLNHHNLKGNILYYSQTSQTALGTQDKDDYGYLWGY